jgi:hypothetical protein
MPAQSTSVNRQFSKQHITAFDLEPSVAFAAAGIRVAANVVLAVVE